MLDPVLSLSTELAGFRAVIFFTTPRHFVRSYASSFPSPFFFISFSTCFFHVCFGLPLQPLTSNFKTFTITFSSSFLKTCPYHCILLALAILSKDSFMPNMSINSSLFLRSNSFTHRSNHSSFCSSQNCDLFFSQAPCFTSIQHS